MEITSGGQGRTTATLTVTPFSNMDTTQHSRLSLAMEYRLSGGLNRLLRRPWNQKTRNELTTIQQQEQEQPQHWIRQIWELHPHGSSSSTRNLARSFSVADGIIASQYQWLIVWPSGQSVRTIFDPPKSSDWNRQDPSPQIGGVSFTWTDPTNPNPYYDMDEYDNGRSGDGTWITDIRIPFVRHSSSDNITRQSSSLLMRNLFATEIRVRRQFRF
jgi:hypothetical protein